MTTLPPLGWYVDRTRYEQGFTCPWRRLLGFHAYLTGLSPLRPHLPLITGLATHKALELLLHSPDLPTLDRAAHAASAALSIWESELKDDPATRDLVTALTHGYARTVAPTLLSQFEILHIEQEFTLQLPPEPFPIIWMARPDLVCRNRSTGALSIHDFKTNSYWKDSYLREWGDSLQLMMNAHTVATALGEPVPSYYVHFLVKGSTEYPPPLTHAWYRPPSPPFEADDWQLKKPYRRGGLPYERILVSSRRSLADWVWSLAPEVLSKSFILGGPFPVSPHKVHLFTQGLASNEWWWRESLTSLLVDHGVWDLDSPHFRALLDRTFPRTFQCYTYNSRCAFYDLCFKPETRWQTGYVKRTPHHTTEVVDE